MPHDTTDDQGAVQSPARGNSHLGPWEIADNPTDLPQFRKSADEVTGSEQRATQVTLDAGIPRDASKAAGTEGSIGDLVDVGVRSIGELRLLLRKVDEGRLARLGVAVWDVLVEKARERGDMGQLVEDALNESFDAKDQMGNMPWLDEGGVLWAPGSLQDKSAARHLCRFVRVSHNDDSYWVWEHPGQLLDKVRKTHNGTKVSQRSITLVLPQPGAAVDVVTSVAVAGMHKVRRVDSFVVKGSELEKVSTRRVADGERAR